jgi:molybdopterin molybdotransferase
MAAFETREPDWLSFEEALGRILSIAARTSSISQPIGDALGLALSEEVRASRTLPPGPTSHMDGYALRVADVIQRGKEAFSNPIPVVGVSRPGAPWRSSLPEGHAVRIMTGALVPEGADVVVPVEHTDREATAPGTVRISSNPKNTSPGRYIRPAGEELTAGECVARPGETITPGLLSLLCASGEPVVPVHRAPTVALLVTGDELVPAGNPEALAEGVFRADVLSPSLPPFIREGGGVCLFPRHVEDNREALRGALTDAASEADLIVTTGGASMGETDLVKRVLEEMGFRLDFWRVRIRPGSPVSLGWLSKAGTGRQVAVLGLPGNPASAIVTFLILGLPLLRTLGGHARRRPPSLIATARERLSVSETLTQFFRVRLDRGESGPLGATPTASQGSGAIRSLSAADGLAIVPPGGADVERGAAVEVQLIPACGWR